MINMCFLVFATIIFYSIFVINFNYYRDRIYLASISNESWATIAHYVCAVMVLMTIIPTFILFTTMLIKNGFNPISISDFNKITGDTFGFFSISRFKETTEVLYHGFVYSMTIVTIDFILAIKGEIDIELSNKLRFRFLWYWAYTVICYYLLGIH